MFNIFLNFSQLSLPYNSNCSSASHSILPSINPQIQSIHPIHVLCYYYFSYYIIVFYSSIFRKPQFSNDGLFFVKHKNQYIATVLAWQDEEVTDVGRLHWLAVLPDHRGKGIGKALCLCILKFFKDHKKASTKLRTETFRDKAIQLYESVGFVRVMPIIVY